MPYKPGDNYVICDQCGFRRYASECRMTWNGWFVCADTCYEDKHHALIPKPLPVDKIRPKTVRNESYYFIEPEE